MSAGLYVHFPYCVSICNYCDFDRQATGFASIPRYVASVIAEIGHAAAAADPQHLLRRRHAQPDDRPAGLARSCRRLARQFERCPVPRSRSKQPGECTVERLSGVPRGRRQSAEHRGPEPGRRDPGGLSRRHTADEARAAVTAAREAGFDNLSLDFMLGLAGMTVQTWLATLERQWRSAQSTSPATS